jgi:hypothetical protein
MLRGVLCSVNGRGQAVDALTARGCVHIIGHQTAIHKYDPKRGIE